MPKPTDRGQPPERPDGPPLEPVRVLRPRNTDALAELIREFREQTGAYQERRDHTGDYEVVPLPRVEAETQELPPVADKGQVTSAGHPTASGHYAVRGGGSVGRVPGLRRTAVVGAVAAAALIGFGCAFLLPDRSDASAAQPALPSTPASATPTPTASAATDPDGPGTLREGAAGPEVTDLQQRLLRIPNVYDHGSTSGSYDATLTEAVARFQVWYGIRGDETGVYGDDTRLALESRTGG
ncbi:peptidoglycan-binding domain-containing protein [Streptomyces plumbiresistens]|uniref:Peptidoglycan binding-like domain-containing protein n=1 Tax=Streptomyces plumbiresistens TaxID=511811 RepID=A0ABP7QLI5_9ACTN